MYDDREAAAYIAERTGETLETAQSFVEKHSRYMELNGQMDGVHFESEAERDAEKELHFDLFLLDCHEDQNNVLEYIARNTSLPRPAIANMYAEEVSYMVTKGIMEPDSFPYFQSWADAVSQAEQEAEDALPLN